MRKTMVGLVVGWLVAGVPLARAQSRARGGIERCSASAFAFAESESAFAHQLGLLRRCRRLPLRKRCALLLQAGGGEWRGEAEDATRRGAVAACLRRVARASRGTR